MHTSKVNFALMELEELVTRRKILFLQLSNQNEKMNRKTEMKTELKELDEWIQKKNSKGLYGFEEV